MQQANGMIVLNLAENFGSSEQWWMDIFINI